MIGAKVSRNTIWKTFRDPSGRKETILHSQTQDTRQHLASGAFAFTLLRIKAIK
jgi:hypothetical protein